MSARSKLFRWKDPWDHSGTEDLFLQAMKDNLQEQWEHCLEYRSLAQGMDFHPNQLQTMEDLYRLPPLPTLLFKRRKIFGEPQWRIVFRASSSGTTGRASEMGFRVGDLLCALQMGLRIAGFRGLLSPKASHCILLSPKPDGKKAAPRTAWAASLLSPVRSRTYALRQEGAKLIPDIPGTADALLRYGSGTAPVRIIGFPAFAWFLLQQLESQGERLHLPKGSKLLLGGGWKEFSAQQADKSTFYALAEDRLGLSGPDIAEFFSAVEHPVLFTDCPNRHLHIPIYSRVLIRDANTLEPLPPGQPGIVNLITPMVQGTPVLSILTDDIGILHPAGSCGCGTMDRAPWLELLGRGGISDLKTCAAGAAEAWKGAAL